MTIGMRWGTAVRAGRRAFLTEAAVCVAAVATMVSAPRDVERQGQPEYAIAFASFAPLDSDIFIADADGGNPRALLSTPGFEANASFSPDGRWIVFSSSRGGSWDIWRAHLDGSALEPLVGDPAFDDQAALSPDGRSLAFVSSRSGEADIWIMDMATRRSRNLTRHPSGDFRPAWSPDGQWIAFTTDRDSTRPGFRRTTS